ncbi:MAG: hypothetical protein ACP5G6_09170, partial [Conexivisphaera sp.]
MSSRTRGIRGWLVYMITAPLAVLAAWLGYYLASLRPESWQASLAAAALMGVSVGWIIGGFSMYYEQMRSERITLPG